MTVKLVTDGWIVWRLENGVPEFLGVFPSEKSAKENIAVLDEVKHKGGWHCSNALFLGFAFNRDTGKVYPNSDPAPPTSSTAQ